MTHRAFPIDDGSEPDWDLLMAVAAGVAPPLVADEPTGDQGSRPPLNLVGAVDTFSAEDRARWQEQDEAEWQLRMDEQQWLEDQGQ